jgi:hypothetical protein
MTCGGYVESIREDEAWQIRVLVLFYNVGVLADQETCKIPQAWDR